MTKRENSGFTKQYACPMCDELCDTKAEAKSHCIDEIRVVFSCDECGEEFDGSNLAKACCPAWVCTECGDSLDSSDHRCPCTDEVQ